MDNPLLVIDVLDGEKISVSDERLITISFPLIEKTFATTPSGLFQAIDYYSTEKLE